MMSQNFSECSLAAQVSACGMPCSHQLCNGISHKSEPPPCVYSHAETLVRKAVEITVSPSARA
jgi:hypothetical protein